VLAAIAFAGSIIASRLRGPILGLLVAALVALLVGIGAYLSLEQASDRYEQVVSQVTVLQGSLTGAGSYPRATVMPSTLDDSASFMFMVKGDHPLYDVSVSIYDLTRHRLVVEKRIGTLPVNVEYSISSVAITPDADRHDFLIDMFTRTGVFRQQEVLARVGDTWQSSTRLTGRGRDGSVVTLEEQIRPGVPFD
jgi:hypothetical protein